MSKKWDYGDNGTIISHGTAIPKGWVTDVVTGTSVPQRIRSIYLIASLRNKEVVQIGNRIRELGIEAFDDWSSPGPEADDYWKQYSEARGQTYKEALNSYAAQHVFEFDKYHLDRCDSSLLILPAGRSCGIEFGWSRGRGKPGWILLDRPDRWDVMFQFASGVYDSVDDFIKILGEQQNAAYY